jgi:hypothetical protein
VIRRRFPVGASPTRPSLQPEAAGAAKEVTNWLKPSEWGSRIGDSASVQAVTRVNAEQAWKRTMRRPTRRPFRGRLTRLGYRAKSSAQPLRRGSGDSMYTRKAYATREAPWCGQSNEQLEAREGQAGRLGVSPGPGRDIDNPGIHYCRFPSSPALATMTATGGSPKPWARRRR